MIRVLTCLGMVSVLLLTSFVTNVYAAEDFPTSDLGVPSSEEFHEAKITLSGFPGQAGESVTYVDLTPSPCSSICTGFSDITIPGIGDGHLLVTLHNHKATATHPPVLQGAVLLIIGVAFALTPVILKSVEAAIFGDNPVTVPITGQNISGSDTNVTISHNI
jgi:hypothetical protein